MKKVPAPRVVLPQLSTDDLVLRSWAGRLIDNLVREFSLRPTKIEPQDSVLLLSPGGKTFAIKVADDGTVSSELVQG